MDDGRRLPPGRTLRLTILDGAIHNHFHAVAHPAARGCGACHRPWEEASAAAARRPNVLRAVRHRLL